MTFVEVEKLSRRVLWLESKSISHSRSPYTAVNAESCINSLKVRRGSKVLENRIKFLDIAQHIKVHGGELNFPSGGQRTRVVSLIERTMVCAALEYLSTTTENNKSTHCACAIDVATTKGCNGVDRGPWGEGNTDSGLIAKPVNAQRPSYSRIKHVPGVWQHPTYVLYTFLGLCLKHISGPPFIAFGGSGTLQSFSE